MGNSIRFSSAWKIAASKAEFLAKKTLFGTNRKPLIPKFITFIPYIAHLFIRMKIIEKDISNLYPNLIKRIIMNKIMCLLFCSFLTNVLWSQQLYVPAGKSVTIAPTAYVYVGDDIEIAATGNFTIASNATHSGALIANTGSITGAFTYERYVPATGTNWNHVAPPVGTQDIQAFVDNTNNAIRTNPATGNYALATWKSENDRGQKWTYHNESPDPALPNQQTHTNFVNGQGYTTSRTVAGTYTFTGAVTDTDVTKTIGGAGLYWTAIGNPYPAFLSAAAVYTANQAVLDAAYSAMYLWDSTLGDSGEWVPFNASSTDQQLHPGKAFLVKANGTGTQNFVFSRAQQQIQGTTTDVFYRTTPVQKIVLRLNNETASASTTLKYFSNTTSGFDLGWDAAAFNGETSSFSVDTHLVTGSEGVNYTLQCLNDNEYEEAPITLAVKAAANEAITFRAEASNLPTDMEVYIEDKINNTIHKISNGASYTVTLANAVEGIGNFYLHASRTTLKTEDLLPVVHSLNAYTTRKENLRITGLAAQENAIVRLYNTLGQEVFEHRFASQNVNDIALPNLRSGIYIVKIAGATASLTKKIILE